LALPLPRLLAPHSLLVLHPLRSSALPRPPASRPRQLLALRHFLRLASRQQSASNLPA